MIFHMSCVKIKKSTNMNLENSDSKARNLWRQRVGTSGEQQLYFHIFSELLCHFLTVDIPIIVFWCYYASFIVFNASYRAKFLYPTICT